MLYTCLYLCCRKYTWSLRSLLLNRYVIHYLDISIVSFRCTISLKLRVLKRISFLKKQIWFDEFLQGNYIRLGANFYLLNINALFIVQCEDFRSVCHCSRWVFTWLLVRSQIGSDHWIGTAYLSLEADWKPRFFRILILWYRHLYDGVSLSQTFEVEQAAGA